VTGPAAPRMPRSTGRAGELARGLAAALVLVVLVAGLPVLLGIVAPLPAPEPDWSRLGASLTARDDGRLLLLVLRLAAWAGWASFAAAVAVEAAAQLRGATPPRLPLLRLPQQAAASLVAAAAVLITPTATGPAPEHRPPGRGRRGGPEAPRPRRPTAATGGRSGTSPPGAAAAHTRGGRAGGRGASDGDRGPPRHPVGPGRAAPRRR
jgi:hypothetical protein